MKKKILIVDDDEDILFTLGVMLKNAGYEVISSLNGMFVLDGEYDPPDLFLLDKRIPDVDGLEICRQLRKRIASKHTPIVILSATPQTRGQALEAGANDFLEKPFEMKVLLQMVNRYVTGASARPASTGAASTGSSTGPSTSPATGGE